MHLQDIKKRIVYHPAGPESLEKFETYRNEAYVLALKIDSLCPEGREKSLALTKLEEVLFWADAAITRNS